MLPKSFDLHLATPAGESFRGQAEGLTVQTDDGEIQILPGHSGLIATITFSRAEIFESGQRREILLRRGLVWVRSGGTAVDLVCMAAEPVETARLETLEEYLNFIQEAMAKRQSLGDFQVRYLEDQMESARRMVEVVRKARPEGKI